MDMKQTVSFIITLLCALCVLCASAQTERTNTIPSRQLDEVVVKGEKPQVRAEDGVMFVDLPGIVRDKPVNNILEALGYLPGVTNNNGLIWLTGASNDSEPESNIYFRAGGSEVVNRFSLFM